MSYQLVIDPETKEEKYEWVDRTESSADQQRREIKERRENAEPFDLKEAAIGTAKAVPRMFVNAGINAVQEGSDTIRDIAAATPWVDASVGTSFAEPDKPILGLGDWKPETLESSGMAEDIGTSILQFGLEWVMLSKALRIANWGLKATPLAKPLAYAGAKSQQLKGGILKTVGKSPVAPRTLQDVTKFGIKTATATSPRAAFIDFAGFDQYEGRLYDLAANSDTWFNNVKHIPLVNQLATNPEDEGLKGRLKNALEGGFIDLGIGGAISTASAVKVIDSRIKLNTFLKTPKDSPNYARIKQEAIQAGAALEKIPEIKKALSDDRKVARMDRAAFDKARADLPPAERDRVWKEMRTRRGLVAEKRGVKTVTGDLDSIRRQIEELGPEPPKPGKGQSIVNGKHTPAYKRWNKWNRTNKSLQARLQELENTIDPTNDAYTRELAERRMDDETYSYEPGDPEYRDVASQNAKEMADAIESGDVPYWWGPGDPAWKAKDVEFWGDTRKRKVDENVAAMVMEGRSVSEIIENLKANRPQRIPGEPGFPSIADAKGISLANYRGVDKIKAKLRSLVGQDFKFTNKLTGEESIHRYTRDDYAPVYEFIELMGEELFDDVALSLKQIDAEGSFNFARKLIEIQRRTIATGQFSDTMVHELWHSLSRYLPAKDLKRYAKEWKSARERYLKDMRKKLIKDPKGKDGKVLSAEQVRKLRDGLVLRGKELVEEMRLKMKEELGAEPAREDVLDAFAKTAESKRMQKTFDKFEIHRQAQAELDGFRNGKYTNENYRFIAMDEYFAEMLKDQFFLHINKKALAPEGSFRRLLQDVGIFFKELWVQIHAALGGPNTEKIFNDYLKGRNKKKLRKYSMETYFEPGFTEAADATAMVDALDILIAGGRTEVVERSAFDDILFGGGIRTSVDARIKYTPDELADLSDFIRSFEDPTYEKVLKKLDDYLYPEKGDKAAPYPINEKDAERIDDLLDILEEQDPRAYKEWDWMRDEPKARTDVDDPRSSYEQEARIYDEEKARLGEEPAGGRRTKEEVEGLSEDVIEAFEKINSGEADLLDTPAAWQDVTTLRSKKGREYYPGSSQEGGDFEVILDAISHRFDRIMDTGMWSVSPKRIAQELGVVFKEQGINLDKILFDKKLVDATEVFANNVENVTNLLKIRFGLNFAGEQAAKWARLVYQATDNPSINKAEAISEMMRHLETTLQFSRVYQTWTRSAGQLLQSAQAEIITDGLTEATKRTDLNFNKIAALSEAAEVPAETVVSNLPDEILTAMRTGEWTPEAEGFFDQLIMYAMNTNTPEGIKTLQDYIGANIKSKGMRNAPTISNYEKIGKGLANYYVNNILSGAGTWAVQFSGIGRTGVEPLLQSVNALAHGDIQHAKLALMQYDYLRRVFYGSLKLGAKAFELGQSLYDPKIRTAGFATDLAPEMNINSGYARDRAYQLADPHPSFDLNTSPFTREAKGNPGLNVANVLWRLGTWNIRGQLALDTFTKSLAGNALAFITGVEQGLEKGRRLGLEGIDLQNYARKYADGRIEFYTFDAVVNGQTIADALMKDEAAIQIGRILTFTDETRARMPGRNYQYGEELAKARGMTDEKEIAEFAELYQQGGHLEGLERRYNNFIQGNILNQAKNNKSLPKPGDVTPVITSVWSQIPMRWGKFQAGKHGFWASFIQPFNRSPADITKQWLRHTPFAMTVDTFYRDLFNENYFLRNRWKTEQAVGLAATAVFATTVLNDEEFPIEFTGFGPNDQGLRKEWADNERPPLSWRWRGRDANGQPSYGKWHSFRGFEPAATFIGGLGDYKMLYADMSEEQRFDLVAGFSMSLTAQVVAGRFNSTYYKGIVEFIDAIGFMRGNLPGRREMEPSERTKLERYVQRFLANFIPEASRLREISRAIDPYKREIDSGVNPIEAFEEIDRGLVTTEDNQGNIIYLKPTDISGEQSAGDNLMDYISSFFRQQLDEIKNTIPGFSKTLPPRINWITGLPIRNKGFLGSDQLPMDDAPWLSQLTSAYFGTIKGAVSNFGIGATGHAFDPRLEIQKKKGKATYEYKAAIVNDELIKLNRAGDIFEPPRPTDFMLNNVRLSPPAFRQYKEYIYTLPHPKYGGLTLTEALYQRITSKDYQAQDYKVHPTSGKDPLEGFDRSDEIQEIINDYKHNAKQEFRTNPNNPYRMEIQIPEQRIKDADIQKEELRRSGPLYNQGDSMDLNAQDFAASINR